MNPPPLPPGIARAILRRWLEREQMTTIAKECGVSPQRVQTALREAVMELVQENEELKKLVEEREDRD